MRCLKPLLLRPLLASLLIALAAHPVQSAQLVLVAGGREEQEPVLATNAKLQGPFAVDFNSAGTLFFVEMPGQRVRTVDSHGVLKTIAGTGEKGDAGDGASALRASFNGMHSLAVAASGDSYIGDTWNNRIRKIDAAGKSIAAFAGTGRKGFGGDGGPAARAEFGGVYCLAFQPGSERLLIADLDNRRIRAINLATGIVDTVAGNGERGVPTDGAIARESPLVDPRAVAADDRGNFYILERGGNALRVVDATGHIRTVIGQGATECRDEDGREPLPLNGPKHLCVDLDGHVLIADTENHMIRKYLPGERKLVRVAGTGKAGTPDWAARPRGAVEPTAWRLRASIRRPVHRGQFEQPDRQDRAVILAGATAWTICAHAPDALFSLLAIACALAGRRTPAWLRTAPGRRS